MEGLIEARVCLEAKDEFILLGNRVLLRQDKEQETYDKTNILVPEKYKEWVTIGVIKAIGTGVDRNNHDIKVNDKVIFDSAVHGVDMIINDIKYKILHPDDILCIVEEEDAMSR